MANYKHGYFYKAFEVKVDADVIFDMLADWANLYFPSSFPVRLSSKYANGSKAGKYPCQRIVEVDHSTVPAGQTWPKYFAETLYAVNADTRTLIYSVDEGGGSLNYFAANEIDTLGNGESRLAFRARFDLPPEGDVDEFIRHVTGPLGMLVKGYEERAPEFIRNRRPELLRARGSSKSGSTP